MLSDGGRGGGDDSVRRRQEEASDGRGGGGHVMEAMKTRGAGRRRPQDHDGRGESALLGGGSEDGDRRGESPLLSGGGDGEVREVCDGARRDVWASGPRRCAKATEVAMAAAAVGMVRCLGAGDGDREGPGEAIGMRSATRER